MALNIKSVEVERLAAEVASMTNESKTEAIRKSLIERRDRLKVRVSPERRQERLASFLEREVWARIPPKQLGKAPRKKDRERILGYGEHGV
jgi:antitoxin VapB